MKSVRKRSTKSKQQQKIILLKQRNSFTYTCNGVDDMNGTLESRKRKIYLCSDYIRALYIIFFGRNFSHFIQFSWQHNLICIHLSLNAINWLSCGLFVNASQQYVTYEWNGKHYIPISTTNVFFLYHSQINLEQQTFSSFSFFFSHFFFILFSLFNMYNCNTNIGSETEMMNNFK